MSVKIVGAVSDENSLEEIENIAKVFAYEQHMKLYTRPLSPKKIIEQVSPQITPRIRHNNGTTYHFPVKGLC